MWKKDKRKFRDYDFGEERDGVTFSVIYDLYPGQSGTAGWVNPNEPAARFWLPPNDAVQDRKLPMVFRETKIRRKRSEPVDIYDFEYVRYHAIINGDLYMKAVDGYELIKAATERNTQDPEVPSLFEMALRKTYDEFFQMLPKGYGIGVKVAEEA